ncbi:MAG: phosphotransferase [Alphaproteobacteria bacterium]|nr:phosphotransferase [Alphaproteobacteria bacterium]
MSDLGDHGLDLTRLAAWLRDNVPGYAGVPEVERFEGGQSNPTFLLRAASGAYVLRRKPQGALLASAHAVDREFRVLRALHGGAVPVPRPYALCEDPSVIGSSFCVMDFVEGRVFWDQTLPDCTPAERAAIYDSMGATIAALHSVDYRAVGLEGFGKPGAYVARQIDRWTRQYRASETAPIAAMDRLIDWLPRHLPARDATAIVHGDYRIDNLIFHPTEPRVVAVLDWELATLGDPVADFAYHVMSWRIAPAAFRGLAGVDVAALGIPTEPDYVAAYFRRTGFAPVADWDFYVIFGMFKMTAILQGVYKRALDGTAASAQALEVGGRAARMAEQGAALIEARAR